MKILFQKSIFLLPVSAQNGPREESPNDFRKSNREGPEESRPNLKNPGDGKMGIRTIEFPSEFRTISGFGNNLGHPEWGAADIPFLFCLVVLRSTRDHELPHLAVYVAFLLTVSSVTLFLYFVHHLVRSLQAENIVAMVADELINRIDTFFPEVSLSDDEEEAERERKSWDELKDEVSVDSTYDGYLQFVDTSTLLELATRENCRVRAIVRPGQLLLDGECLFTYEKTEGLSEEAVRKFSDCFVMGRKRTPDQDFEFEIRQLVEVGVRALSPGINDPFTAANCIDFLAIALGRIARRSLPRNMFFDDDSNLRLRLRPTSFRNLLETAFLQLRHDGLSCPDICLRLSEALLLIGRQTRNEEQLCAVCDFAELLEQESTGKSSSEFDRKCFQEVFQSILELRDKGE